MSAAQKFSLSISESCKSNEVKQLTFLRLADFAAFIKTSPPVSDKLHSKGIVASLFAGNIRTASNINSCTALTLDYDEPADGLFEAVTSLLEAENIGHVAAGSWSNNGRFFVVIPFATPTSIAGHAATLEYVRSVLGAYATFAVESSRPAQLRFISANADAEYRQFNVFDGALLQPREPAEDQPAAQSSFNAVDTFADMAQPSEKQLFLLALHHGLLRESRLETYGNWHPVLFAGFRAWGIGKKTNKLTEDQVELMEALNVWSSRHPKYVKGCVEKKIGDHLSPGMSTLTIQSLLRMETNHAALRTYIDDPELDRALTRLVGGESVTQVTHINTAAIEAGQTERAAELARLKAEHSWASAVLSRMPAPTPRFAEFREIITAISTQGEREFWELPSDRWGSFLRPIPVIMSLVQIAALGFMPHTMFRYGNGISPKALNLYFLHIAAAGTGKSEVFKAVHAALEQTIFRHCNPREKLHSATGLWVNHFEATGGLQLMTSEEAESLFGKFGNIDQHLAALHTCIKELFDKGIPGQTYRPSAQVQRVIRPVMAPTLSLNLAGTPRLLNGDITATMLGDGFMSRMITYINDNDPSTLTEEQILAAKLRLMQSEAASGMDANAVRAGRFFRDLWRASDHPAGEHIFNMPLDDRDTMIEVIRNHFENPELVPRYIRPGRNEADMKAATVIYLRAQTRYPIPRGMVGTPTGEAIQSLQARAELKLSMLTSILTLIADPTAEYLNLEIMEWAEELLFAAQRDFYNHLLGGDHTMTSILPKYRINPDMLVSLRPAVQPGGILFGGGLVLARDLRESSRAWRKLITDLKSDPNGERSKLAHEMLIELGVGYADSGTNTRSFFMKPDNGDDA